MRWEWLLVLLDALPIFPATTSSTLFVEIDGIICLVCREYLSPVLDGFRLGLLLGQQHGCKACACLSSEPVVIPNEHRMHTPPSDLAIQA
jgi:hypothetical protein